MLNKELYTVSTPPRKLLCHPYPGAPPSLLRPLPKLLLYKMSAQPCVAHDGSNSYVPCGAPHAPTLRRRGSREASSSLMLFRANTSRSFRSTEMIFCG